MGRRPPGARFSGGVGQYLTASEKTPEKRDFFSFYNRARFILRGLLQMRDLFCVHTDASKRCKRLIVREMLHFFVFSLSIFGNFFAKCCLL